MEIGICCLPVVFPKFLVTFPCPPTYYSTYQINKKIVEFVQNINHLTSCYLGPSNDPKAKSLFQENSSFVLLIVISHISEKLQVVISQTCKNILPAQQPSSASRNFLRLWWKDFQRAPVVLRCLWRKQKKLDIV